MSINHQLGEAGDSTEIFSNFTSPHLVEDKFRVTENIYRSVLEAQTELICRFLPDGTLTFVNSACCRFLGKSHQETIGKNFLMFFGETDRESVIRNLLSGDGNYALKTYEYRAITGNGQLCWQQWIVQPIFDQKRRLIEFQSVGRDITELKQTEEALRQKKERLEGILQSLDDVVWSVDPTTEKTVYVSPAVQKVYGRSVSEFLNNSHLWREVIHPTDRLQLESKIAVLFATGVLHLEYRIVRPNGELRWLYNRMRLIRDEEGNAIGIDGITTDITDRKQAQEELAASKELFRLLLEGVKDYAIYMLDKNGCIVSWNAGAERIYGFKTQEIIGQHFSCFFGSEDIRSLQPVKELQLAISQGRCEIEGWRVRSDGTQFWANVAISTLYDDFGNLRGFAKVTRDITDRKLAQDLLCHRLEMENLISSISSSFINLKSPSINAGINRALQALGEFANVDRAYLFLWKDGDTKLTNSHFWLAGRVAPQFDRLPEITADCLPWKISDLKNLEPLYISTLDELPSTTAKEKEFWQVAGIRSLLYIPLAYGEKFLGFLGFDTLAQVKYWTDEDIKLLKLVGEIFVNLLERQQAENSLIESQKKYQTLFQILPIGISITDEAGNVVEANHASEKILSISTSEHTKRSYNSPEWQIIRPDGTSMPDSEFASAIALQENRIVENIEMGIVKAEREITWISVTAAPIPLPDYGVAIAYIDISERKNAEKALQQAYSDLRDREEQYRTLTTHAPVGIFQTNDRGEVNFVNQRWCEIVGISPEEAYGHSWLQALYFDRRKRSLFEKQQAYKQKANTYEIRFQLPEGKIVWVIVHTAPIHDKEGNFAGIIGTIMDITDRKNAEKALRQSEAKFQKLAANLPGTIYQLMMGWDGTISFSYISAGCWDIYELEPEKIQRNASLIIDIIHPDERHKFEESLTISAKTLESWRWEGRIIVNGKIKWLQSAARPEKKVNGDIIWDGLLFDISDRKTAELRLTKINQCFLNFSSNPTENIDSLTALCGELLGSASTIYTGMEGEKLETMSAWHKYLDRKLLENSESNLLCYEAIEAAGSGIFTVGNLSNSQVFEKNLKIAGQQKIQTYFGWSVKGKNNSIGALCAVYPKKFIPNEDDEKVMGIIAAAIGVEEERRRVEEALRLQTQQERSIGAIAQRIRQTLNLDEILNTMVEEVLQLLQCDRVLIFRLYPDGTGKVTTEAVKSGWPATLGETFPHECFPSECYENYCHGNPRAITDVARDFVATCLVEYLQKVGVKSKLVVPILQHQMLWGLLIVHQCGNQRIWQKGEIDLLSSLATQAAIAIQQSQLYQQLELANQELHRLVTVDGLTQVANRRRFDEYLLQEWRRLAREQAPLSLIMCDVDFFKLYNDTYGHQAGDECLIQVASAIEKSIKRPADLVARYGGEEFAVILPNTDAAGATCVAEEIRIAIKALEIPHCTSRVSDRVTISLGVATIVPFPAFSPEMLIDAADRALYQAKDRGRDRYYLMT